MGYRLKKEVAFLVNKPHYALFSSFKQVGSMHDYQTCFYVIKTQEEQDRLSRDTFCTWAILLDSDYIGPDSKHTQNKAVGLEMTFNFAHQQQMEKA